MIGTRIGSRASFIGSSIGTGSDDEGSSGSMAGVTQDAGSLIYVPATPAEWAQALAVAGIGSGGPGWGWGFQDLAGNPAALFGPDALTAAGTGATYGISVGGWSRTGITTADAATASFSSTAADLPATNLASSLLLAYINFGAAPASERGLYEVGTTGGEVRLSTVSKVIKTDSSVATGVVNTVSSVHPVVGKLDRNLSAGMLYTDLEKVGPTTIGTVTGKRILFGNTGARLCPAYTLMYAVLFSGAAAELSDAQIKTLLQVLGWTILWT